ncbi:short-chain dehydrogenase [Flavihumibacter rivuli]|uniref:short-chain dehydrogenase n=1 Tax=Flavihumibacter rivuli TaxID=2838156 RepID=UPI001BDF05BE|nr:short-chain dehydrogenase [Flavihumibacter rivuli]ULQ57182.1 short-chain dehydrogenase [Flavihumibacter rivuli]
MTNIQIEKFLDEKAGSGQPIRITLKSRKPFLGIFIKTNDFGELKSKNFWRIVSEGNIENYLKNKDNNLARIFAGSDITKLSLN